MIPLRLDISIWMAGARFVGGAGRSFKCDGDNHRTSSPIWFRYSVQPSAGVATAKVHQREAVTVGNRLGSAPASFGRCVLAGRIELAATRPRVEFVGVVHNATRG
jgi:hypothetical protein